MTGREGRNRVGAPDLWGRPYVRGGQATVGFTQGVASRNMDFTGLMPGQPAKGEL